MIKLPEVAGQILFNSSLAKYSWFRVGGNADVLFMPKDIDDLKNFLKNIDKSMPIMVIGGGSNLLIRDAGIRGVVIVLKENFKNIAINNDLIEVDCGILNSKLYNFSRDNGLSGYEFLGTIPGTIGGAIRGNSGCYGSEIKDFLIKIEAIDKNGDLKIFSNEECNFEYRKNNLPEDLIFVKAYLKVNIKESKENIEKKYKEMLEKRNASQPQGVKTCGSTFKNLPDMPAWKAIQEIGYQNKEINGAKMSEKHANFMINTGNATAKSLEELGEEIKKEAKDKLNINLEWEIKIVGDKN